MATTAEQARRYKGPALFSLGFRPFFLGASLWAAFAAPLWIFSLAVGHADLGGRAGLVWHQDEMLFGMLPGVIAGFLLTAVPNWTGRLPVVGAPLIALFGLWALGRLTSVVSAEMGVVATIIDVSFLFLFAAAIWREILSGKNMRNVPVCAMLTLLAFAHLAFHLGDLSPLLPDISQRLALAAVGGLIMLIGGRIVPSFTRNWLAGRGLAAQMSATPDVWDRLAIGVTGLGLAGWIAAPDMPAVGAALVLGGLAIWGRLSRWRGWATLAEPLVWILHVGYAWLGFAFLAIGVSIINSALVPPSAAIHALTAGAAGVMVLAVMTRASLGHTGRPLSASSGTVAIYVLANLAGATRFVAPFMPEAQIALLIASAALWAMAFGGFALIYGPLLSSPRVPKTG